MLVVPLVGAVLAVGVYMTGRTLGELAQELPILPVSLSERQQDMVAIIDRERRRAGLPPALTPAAVVNAWHESRLDPDAVSGYPGEDSVGLFQLNAARGAAGAGMSHADRADPAKNAARIFAVTRDALDTTERGYPSLRMAWRSGTVADLAAAFTRYVERPADRHVRAAERAASLSRFYPELKGVPAASLGGQL